VFKADKFLVILIFLAQCYGYSRGIIVIGAWS